MSDPFDLSQLQGPLNVPFPAATKQVAGVVNGVKTDVLSVEFADKILLTISQRGRLAHWVCVLKNCLLTFIQLTDCSYMYRWRTKIREQRASMLSPMPPRTVFSPSAT